MVLSEALEALAVATIADGRSARTVADYRQKLGALVTFLGDGQVDQVTTSDLRRFVADLRNRETRYSDARSTRPEVPGGLSAASVAGYVRAVKRLFAFLLEDEVIGANPARKLHSPRLTRGEPKAYQTSDLVKLIQATAGSDPVSLRDRAILLFLADTGCRVGGLVGLKVADLDLDQGLAKLTEKGQKTRLAPFSEPTRAALADWLAVRPARAGDSLWVNLGRRGGLAMTEEGVRQVFRRLKDRAGIDGPCNPHAFRHGFAKLYLQTGGDLATLADLLGHASVETTWRHYAIFRTAELQAKHDKHSPIALMGRKGEL